MNRSSRGPESDWTCTTLPEGLGRTGHVSLFQRTWVGLGVYRSSREPGCACLARLMLWGSTLRAMRSSGVTDTGWGGAWEGSTLRVMQWPGMTNAVGLYSQSRRANAERPMCTALETCNVNYRCPVKKAPILQLFLLCLSDPFYITPHHLERFLVIYKN